MTMKLSSAKKPRHDDSYYQSFDQIDGQHPWMDAVPNGYVSYRVRKLNAGKVAYFNFALGKEMGLIPADHPEHLTNELEQKLIETFSLQIINEYDELTKRRIDPDTIKEYKYMATRYLQLQHSNKQGKTSGDGRGIWNGTFRHKGTTWDISSRGTGVTCLAPGAVSANRPLKTGGTEFGYGCGLAEIDELLGAAILAEIMHLQGVGTERVLCIIDLGKGYGIGVRAAPNLLRPAHMFLYLKQERLDDLKAAVNYFIDRQIENKAWKFTAASGNARYDELMNHLCASFADFTAKLDIDYIFAWLDWDGDNVLADAGIIDYGSVRQFGIRHDKYRYDDVERFSTNLNEQKQKARLIVQVFVQMIDYLKTGKKKSLRVFANHEVIEKFNTEFDKKRSDRLLYRMGFNANQRENILSHKKLFNAFDKEFNFFERAKVSGTTEKVADGVNHPALYNMRAIMSLMPQYLSTSPLDFNDRVMDEQKFYKAIISGFAKRRDARMGEKQRRHINAFQELYKDMVEVAAGKGSPDQILQGISQRAAKLNSSRITGNALIELVEEILVEKRKGLPLDQIQKIIDRLVFEQNGMPEVPVSRFYKEKQGAPAVKQDLYSKLLRLVQDNRESI